MASLATAGPRAAGASLARDPALAVTVVLLWAGLALFVLFPLGMLLARLVVDQGHLSVASAGKILTDRHQLLAFRNSLLLGALVGVIG
ncbi:MAG TPA: hypothetical protein VFO33_00265, partial [Casimicrobiaceae bacterium]|nr:hypothetical protein [Casimicrobiaceae bacterium]